MHLSCTVSTVYKASGVQNKWFQALISETAFWLHIPLPLVYLVLELARVIYLMWSQLKAWLMIISLNQSIKRKKDVAKSPYIHSLSLDVLPLQTSLLGRGIRMLQEEFGCLMIGAVSLSYDMEMWSSAECRSRCVQAHGITPNQEPANLG